MSKKNVCSNIEKEGIFMSFHRDDFPKKNVYFYDGHQMAIMFEFESFSLGDFSMAPLNLYTL
jgi:hypothetical protein